jgi:hypothetical protein
VLDLEMAGYPVHSTLIDLSLAPCPRANCTSSDDAVKLHKELALRGPHHVFTGAPVPTQTRFLGRSHKRVR